MFRSFTLNPKSPAIVVDEHHHHHSTMAQSSSWVHEHPQGATRTVYADFGRIAISSLPPSSINDEDALKTWIWQKYQQEIFAAMRIQYTSERIELELCQKRLDLLDKVAQVQRQYLQSEGPKVVYGCLLEGILDLMQSEYGFIGEVKYESDGTMYIQTHASTNIAWDEATQQFYEDNVDAGLKFYNLNSLFGKVLTTLEPVISNDPSSDKRACGIPPGHPALNHFLGIPFFKKGGEIIGMVGIANKPGGYSLEDISFLEPFTVTCSNLIQAYWQIQRNKDLINTLETKVCERTRKLELVNQSLEEANRRVMQASAAQLQHFACMSHEIRTPLNCIIGLSSLLHETELNPMQEESVRMIINSGDLLLTVVNDVLDYSKLESGNVDIAIQNSSLQETLNSVVHSIELKAQSKRITVNTLYGSTVPEMIRTDSRRLQQILYNLLGNAMKFSHEGGVVELSVHLLPVQERVKPVVATTPPTLLSTTTTTAPPTSCPFHRSSTTPTATSDTVSRCPFTRSSTTKTATAPSRSSPKRKHVLRFSVKDYGKGIEKKDFERIFQPFLQANADTERLYGGTGLGLAITAKLVHGLGGTISVDSDGSSWSQFTVEFPFEDAPFDTESVTSVFKGSTVCIIGHETEDVKRSRSIFQQLRVNYFTASDLRNVRIAVRKEVEKNNSIVFLVHEDHYDDEVYTSLRSPSNSVLITFGPKYKVQPPTTHYRSLTQVLPSVLIQSLASHLQRFAVTDAIPPRVGRTDGAPMYSDLRVMIAEDNVINQKVLLRMLYRLGILNVEIVDNGKKAVDREASEYFHVILMDMQMPVMDGIEACKIITQRQGGHPQALVIFITAHVSESFEEHCAEAGSSGFIQKPCNIRSIEKCFQRIYSLLGKEKSETLPLTFVESNDATPSEPQTAQT
jgi:signal transduction histidine kinase/CheY-like chemotaxis protein